LKVKIKTWEEMEKEYGKAEDGIIDCSPETPYCFSDLIEEELPNDRVIDLKGNPPEFGVWVVPYGQWNITKEMIKEVIKN
jgi:hypothetical protein